MKTTIMIVLLSLGLTVGASAQRGGHFAGHGGGVVFVPRTYVGVGLGFGYPFYPYGPYGAWYNPFPPYYYGRGEMPSRLQQQINGIKADYETEIKEVRHDKSLTHKEKKAKVDQLKKDRDDAVVQARHDYFNNSRRNNNGQPQQNNGNGQPDGNGQKPNNGNGSSQNEQPEYQEKGSTNGSQQ